MRQAVVLLAMLAVFAAAPLFGQAQSTAVSISVPVTQVLEGTTQHTFASASAQNGRLIIKSNVPWTLVVSASSQASWRPAGAAEWSVLPAQGILLRGGRGVHTVEYSLTSGPTGVVTFSLVPAR